MTTASPSAPATSRSDSVSDSRRAITATLIVPAPVARIARARAGRSRGTPSKSCDESTMRAGSCAISVSKPGAPLDIDVLRAASERLLKDVAAARPRCRRTGRLPIAGGRSRSPDAAVRPALRPRRARRHHRGAARPGRPRCVRAQRSTGHRGGHVSRSCGGAIGSGTNRRRDLSTLATKKNAPSTVRAEGALCLAKL